MSTQTNLSFKDKENDGSSAGPFLTRQPKKSQPKKRKKLGDKTVNDKLVQLRMLDPIGDSCQWQKYASYLQIQLECNCSSEHFDNTTRKAAICWTCMSLNALFAVKKNGEESSSLPQKRCNNMRF